MVVSNYLATMAIIKKRFGTQKLFISTFVVLSQNFLNLFIVIANSSKYYQFNSCY